MAARHLQRLRAAQTENLDDEESSSEEELVAKRAPFNPFDLLSDEEVKVPFHCCNCKRFLEELCQCHSTQGYSRQVLKAKHCCCSGRTCF